MYRLKEGEGGGGEAHSSSESEKETRMAEKVSKKVME